jgi:hypothetical protein
MSDDQTMSSYNSKFNDGFFHDGFVDGFLIREPQVIVFIRTYGNEAFALVADEVTRMRVTASCRATSSLILSCVKDRSLPEVTWTPTDSRRTPTERSWRMTSLSG